MKPLLIMLLLTSAIFVRGQKHVSKVDRLQSEVDQLKETVRQMNLASYYQLRGNISAQQGAMETTRRLDSLIESLRDLQLSRHTESPQISPYDSQKSGLDLPAIRFSDGHVEISPRQDLYFAYKARPY